MWAQGAAAWFTAVKCWGGRALGARSKCTKSVSCIFIAFKSPLLRVHPDVVAHARWLPGLLLLLGIVFNKFSTLFLQNPAQVAQRTASLTQWRALPLPRLAVGLCLAQGCKPLPESSPSHSAQMPAHLTKNSFSVQPPKEATLHQQLQSGALHAPADLLADGTSLILVIWQLSGDKSKINEEYYM